MAGSEDGGDSKDDYEIKPRFRQYVKEKQFELKDFPQIGLNNAMIVPTKSKSMVSLTRPRAPSTPRMSVALTMEYMHGYLTVCLNIIPCCNWRNKFLTQNISDPFNV